MCMGFGCKGSANTALQIGQHDGGAKNWRDAKSYGSPCKFIRVVAQYTVHSIRSKYAYPDGRCMVATATTSGRPALAVSKPHCLALDNIKARCIIVPSLQTACA